MEYNLCKHASLFWWWCYGAGVSQTFWQPISDHRLNWLDYAYVRDAVQQLVQSMTLCYCLSKSHFASLVFDISRQIDCCLLNCLFNEHELCEPKAKARLKSSINKKHFPYSSGKLYLCFLQIDMLDIKLNCGQNVILFLL